MKIIISAYACEPGKGSEPGIGWTWAEKLSKYHEVYVITRANNKKSIEEYMRKEKIGENLRFVYYDLPFFFQRLKKKKAIFLYVYYFLWQLGITRIVRQLLQENKIDFVMHLTFGNLFLPTFLPFVTDNIVIGPIGGGEHVPFRYLRFLPFRERIIRFIHLLLVRTAKINPYIHFLLKRTRLIFLRTEDTLSCIPKKFRNKARIMLETGLDSFMQELIKAAAGRRFQEGTPKILYVGRLEPVKNILTSLKALEMIFDQDFEFLIVGEGSMKKNLERFVYNSKINGKVKFLDYIPRDKLLSIYITSDIFLFTSLKEGGAWSLLEAMSAGLAIVCFNVSGARVITDERSARRINLTSPEKDIISVSSALKELIYDREARIQLSKNALESVKMFDWDLKIEEFNQVISNILEESKNE